MCNVSAIPAATQADLLIFHSLGREEQLTEMLQRPRELPALPRVANDASVRMEREAALAQSLKLPRGSPSKKGGPNKQMDQHKLAAHLACAEQRKKWGLEVYGSTEALRLPQTGSKAALHSSTALLAVRALGADHVMMALKRVFERYNAWERGCSRSAMDRVRFAKLLRDTGCICEGGPLTSGAADAVFARVLAPAKVCDRNF